MQPARVRIPALDIVRGFALLGILTMNVSLALPGPARLVPTIAGGFSGANFAVWVAGFLLFDEKMITLFCLLFGAGIYLSDPQGSRRRHFIRRQLVLLVMGLLHAYLIWEGDILVSYALCGMAVYPLRKLPPRRLLGIALALWLVSVGLAQIYAGFIAAGGDALHPDAAAVQRMIEQNRNSTWLELCLQRAPETLAFQILVLPVSFFWTISARMLAGIALFKLGVLAGLRSPGFYWKTALLCYVIGFPIVALAMFALLAKDFNAVFLFRAGLQINQFGSFFVAIGHACVLLWLHTVGKISWLLDRLARVGQMSLTNYLLQSLLLTTFFYGYGFAQFGRWSRVELCFVVLAIWVFQLWLSTWWLRRAGNI